MKNCIIIGISDSRDQWFEPKVLEAIKTGKVFSGGKRHHEIMEDFLPENAVWIDITIPLDNVFAQYRQYEDIVIFASGDPLFFGFAATVRRELPECRITVFPYFNSLQMLAHRMCIPYQDMHVVSLTGRPWDKLDEALINGEPLIGCLTDRNKTPETIWSRMAEYGYDNYEMTVGECLGNETEERITTFGGQQTFRTPNCLILRKTYDKPRHFGIPESGFELLDGRAKMITKAPIRLITLSALDVHNAHTFWDIGFCTGSVSIEAKLTCPHLRIESFEIRPECEDIIGKNMKHFGAPGINIHIGDFLSTDLTDIPAPDTVFIGGHGGKLIEIIGKVLDCSRCDKTGKNIRFVINAVSGNSRELMYKAAEKYKMMLISDNRVALDNHNPINIITFVK